LDIHRYEGQNIYSKITGKSLFKDYELILSEFEVKVREKMEKQI